MSDGGINTKTPEEANATPGAYKVHSFFIVATQSQIRKGMRKKRNDPIPMYSFPVGSFLFDCVAYTLYHACRILSIK